MDELNLKVTVDEVNRRITEAQRWHEWLEENHASADGRSALLRPERLPRDIYWKEFDWHRWGPWSSSPGGLEEARVLQKCVELVAGVVVERRQLLAAKDVRGSPNTRSGKLVLFQPHMTMALTQAQYASGGVLDEYDEVGWDWWVGVRRPSKPELGFEGSGVVAWIPANVVDAVDAAMEADAALCLSWISQLGVPGITAFPAGLEARKQGELEGGNPYAGGPHADLEAEWARGWQTADSNVARYGKC